MGASVIVSTLRIRKCETEYRQATASEFSPRPEYYSKVTGLKSEAVPVSAAPYARG